MTNKKVIFVGGSSYSGSTILDMMLSNSPKGFSLGEIHALFRPYRPHHFTPMCGCNNNECNIWSDVKSAGEDKLYSAVFKKFPKVDYLIDSSKNPLWIKEQSERLKKQNIDVQHVLIWKSPEYFAHSMLKRGKTKWKKAWINYYQLYLHHIRNFHSIPYESLVESPSNRIKEVCNYCGIEYQPEMEAFWGKQHHTLFGNKSAKIHLTNTPIDQGNNDTKESSHRKIYNKSEDIKELPKNILSEVHSNKKMLSIVQYLNESNTPQKNSIDHNQYKINIKLSPIKETYFLFGDRLKSIAGKLLGKHYRIF